MSGTRDARQRLLAATVQLLGEGGVQAATPGAVAERAGAGKMSVYRHFAGKDELIAAALRDYDAPHRARLLDSTNDRPPLDRLRAMFDRAAGRADRPGYSGCPYVIARLDLPDPRHPVAAIARAHKDAMREAIAAVLAEAGHPAPAPVAATVLMLFDGAVVAAVLAGDGRPMRQARTALDRLISWD